MGFETNVKGEHLLYQQVTSQNFAMKYLAIPTIRARNNICFHGNLWENLIGCKQFDDNDLDLVKISDSTPCLSTFF